jgi:DNA mismatch repair protein MutS2
LGIRITSAAAQSQTSDLPHGDFTPIFIVQLNHKHRNKMINEKALHILEFNKIMEQVAAHCSFSAGAEIAREMLPSIDLDEARSWQRETAEVLLMLRDGSTYSLRGARDVREVSMNAQRGVIIEANVLLDIRYTLKRGAIIKRSMAKLKGQFPLMAEITDEIEEVQALQDSIETCINDNAEIKDTASAKLAIIRRDMKISYDRLQSKLNAIIQRKSNQLYLQEPIVTQRNGRYVVPIKADYKGKIPGIVHDSSSSGATLFIEPMETVELNNRWRELQLEEEKEIRRILAELTDLVGEASEAIVRTVEILAYLDFTLAKALYADKLKAVEPQLVGFVSQKHVKQGITPHPGSTIMLSGARHPLLTGDVVPLDIEFGDATWVMVITGPNTGGKTVTLKTIGLLCLMAQAGLHVPANQARFSVFEGVFADIGDEQSIEQSLSTFSSHMRNIIAILDECNERSLVILDEVGAGTDPAEGAALAKALLNRLREQRVTTMVSTHHPELKIYAVETLGVRNASVEFDLETLAPTYRLIVGLPGRSNALAIATRLGLDETIIEDARQFVATEELVADDLLDEIQRTRHEITKQRQEIQKLRDEAAEKRNELQKRLDNIEDERRDVIREARREAEAQIQNFQEEVKQLRKELRQASLPLERLQALQEAAEKIVILSQEPLDTNEVQQLEDVDWKPKLGDAVFLETLNSEGTIVELDDKEATVQVGTLRVKAKYHDLRKRNRAERRADEAHLREKERLPRPRVQTLPQIASPGMELDLRGERVEEALERLDRYVDAAYISGLPFGRIIHGKGTGKLREAVRDFLLHHSLVSKVTGAEANEGGSGVTVIHLMPHH